MREHQIIITLKPDQFLLVQKLAREAGAKSMGLFVRQQLLIALGIEASPNVQPSPTDMAGSAGPDLEPIKNELKVLHAQLRAIVAESLTSYSDELDSAEPESAADFAEGLPSAAIKFSMEVTADGGAAGSGSDADSIEDAPENDFAEDDELEQIAKKTFAISPRLGEFKNAAATSFESGFAQADGQAFGEFSQSEPVSGQESPPLAPGAAAFIPGTTRPSAPQPFDQSVAPTPEIKPSVSSQPAEPSRRSPLFGEPPVVPNSSPLNSRTNSLEAPTGNAQPQQADSPRDPLSDLLDSSDTEGAKFVSPEEADDESFDVPLSIMTRRRQMEALAKALAEGSKETTGSTNAVSSQPPLRANKADLSEKNHPPDKPAQVQPEVPKPVDSQSVSGTYQRYNPLGNPDEDSPFSGGPPPKKRQ